MTTRTKKQQAYLENYEKMVRKLHLLSRIYIRQFLGTRPEGDPRVDYLTGLEGFKNLANAQLSGVVRILTMMLGGKKQEFLDILEEELGKQIKAMEEDLAVTSWDAQGNPTFDLQVFRQRTATWPL